MLYEVITDGYMEMAGKMEELAKHVITSYSIHYTKLYEGVAGYQGGGFPRGTLYALDVDWGALYFDIEVVWAFLGKLFPGQ